MRILALETAGDWCGVAVGDGTHWHVAEERAGPTHSEHALILARTALGAAGWSLGALDGIAFGAGPGAFTGVRMACAIAQGLAFGADLPVIAVPTLAALAEAVREAQGHARIVSCIDARMHEVYVAAYEWQENDWREVMAPAVMAPAALEAPLPGEWVGAGNGFALDPDLAARLGLRAVDVTARATARAVGALALTRLAAGEGVDAAAALPVYVRQRVALTTAERAAGARL